MTRLRMGKSVHRWEVVIPAFVRLRIFRKCEQGGEVVVPALVRLRFSTPFCFGSCMIPQQFGGLH
jgi:hypothetical protein